MEFQSNLIQHIDSLIANKSFPRTSLFEGSFGCGKHTLSKYVADKLNLQLVDISKDVTQEKIEEIYTSPVPCVYMVDCSYVTIREQNILLKFLEEPPKSAYIILLTECKERLLKTVINRCQPFTFEQYTVEQLNHFIGSKDNEYLLEFCDTPGRLLQLQSVDVKSIVEYAERVLLKVGVANHSNILKVPLNFYYKDKIDGLFDFNVFLYLLRFVALKLYTQQKITIREFSLTTDLCSDCTIANINKQQLFEVYLFNMRGI